MQEQRVGACRTNAVTDHGGLRSDLGAQRGLLAGWWAMGSVVFVSATVLGLTTLLPPLQLPSRLDSDGFAVNSPVVPASGTGASAGTPELDWGTDPAFVGIDPVDNVLGRRARFRMGWRPGGSVRSGMAPAPLWPVAATAVTSAFGERSHPISHSQRFHYGVDFAVDYGSPVRATATGTVLRSRWDMGHGLRVVLQHRHGYRSSYSHLSEVLVRAGALVGAGAPVGRVGSSGRVTGPHLHFEVTHLGRHVDPLGVLGAQALRL